MVVSLESVESVESMVSWLASGLGDTAFVVSILIVAAIGFVAFWSGICGLIGVLSGWWGLGRRYRTQAPPPPGAVSPRMVLGLMGYQVVDLGFTRDGLDMRIMALFRPGHPPLRIPWEVIRVEAEGFSWQLFGRATTLRLGPAGVKLRLPSDVWAEGATLRRPEAS